MKLASIFEQLNDACLVLDEAGRISFGNEAAARLIGRPREQLIGQTLPQTIAAGIPLADLARDVARTGHPLSTRQFAAANGKRFDLRITPAGDSIVCLCAEAPPSRDADSGDEEQLVRLLAQVNETNRELESLSYTVSHDLRAPLRHVEAFAGLLEQSLAGKIDTSSAEYLSVITQSARQMNHLLEGVLSYSRLCRRDVNLTSVSLDHALKAVLQDLKLEMQGREVDVQFTPLPEVEGDPWMIRELLAHLLRNALKFTRTRNPARIEITSSTAPGEVQLHIRDNGVGFDADYADRLFGLFQRLHTDPQFEGRGVGLAHVRRMIQRLGGRIWAEGKPDAGATFHVALPKAR